MGLRGGRAAASIPAMDRRPAHQPPLPLPPNHPLHAQMQTWTRLRDQLAELNAQLETLRLMARLQQRR